MDKEQARFILQSFRPDGADAADADFAAALQLAVEDRELGEWLAEERATDAEFAAALCEVEIPEELRQHILAVMSGEKLVDFAMDEAMDRMLVKAMGDIQPPAGLRDQIVAAMRIQEGGEVAVSDRSLAGWFSGWVRVAAVAAAVVLGVLFAVQLTPDDLSAGRLASHDIQYEAGLLLNASFQLDMKDPDQSDINTWLVSNELPAPESLPVRLAKMKGLGCKKVRLSGDKSASLVCFLKEDGAVVHLVIVKNEDVVDSNLPTLDKVCRKDCYHCPETEWNVVRWRDERNTYILLSKSESSRKEELLEFF